MKRPKPVVLEPNHVGLSRFGREMGSDDVCSALLVRDPVLSFDVSRAIDRAIEEQTQIAYAAIDEEIHRAETFGRWCASCGGKVRFYGKGVFHAADCDLDRSLTPQQRYALRNPDRFRLAAIRKRWAAPRDAGRMAA